MFSNKLYNNKFFPYFAVFLATVISTLILWLPFILRLENINGIKTGKLDFYSLAKNWDGPLYIIVAKTFYHQNDPVLKKDVLGLNPKYFAAHLPLYPLTIKTLSALAGYPRASLFSTLIASVFFFCFFYYFVEKLKLSKYPLVLTLVLMFITPRFFVVRSIGSPEPLFMLLVLLSVYFFINKRYFFSGLIGGLAAMTKTPAMLLFGAYLLFIGKQYLETRKFDRRLCWLLLIPFGLILVFTLYQIQYGDFLAYFKSGDNLHLVFPPFSVFNFQKTWVGTGWLEEIIFLYFFFSLATFKLWGETDVRRIFFYFMFLFFISITLVQHHDISRYALPMLPFAAISYEKFFTSKKFLLALLILLPAIYFYAWNFMLTNSAPITDWGPFL